MRKCDECQVCCVVKAIKEIKKPAFTICNHQCSLGCAIYESRPVSCAAYSCSWLSGMLPDNWRPDISGILIDVVWDTLNLYERKPGALIKVIDGKRVELHSNQGSRIKALITVVKPKQIVVHSYNPVKLSLAILSVNCRFVSLCQCAPL